MKTKILSTLALLAHLCSCSTPTAAPATRPAKLGRIGIVCAPGSAGPKVERPDAPGELFKQGTTRHASSVVSAGAKICEAEYGAIIGFPLMATAIAAPLTGIVNATRGVPKEIGARHQAALRSALNSGNWTAVMAAKLRNTATSRGHAPVCARTGELDLEGTARESRCAAVRSAGGDTLAEVELLGPSLVSSGSWAQHQQVRVALRVKFVNARTGSLRRTVWIQIQDGPKRSQKDWAADPAALAKEAFRAIDKAAQQFAEKLSTEGGSGEVVTRQGTCP